VIAQEIVEDLEAALSQFATIALLEERPAENARYTKVNENGPRRTE
jgi:hypothetical protein